MVRLEAGLVIGGDYRVLSPLAAGGMGAVYVVEQLSTGRRRALKVLHPQLAFDGRMRERFAQEAQVGSRVDSEHVVEVVAAGYDDANGVPWLAMELLEGETLARRVANGGPLALAEARQVFAEVCHALDRAHAAGIVHRDLKPENVFLARTRRIGGGTSVKILDFGIAKWMHEMQGAAAATEAIGSPLWLAPEQCGKGHVTPQTDVWALGLMVFHALTGRVYWTCATEPDAPIARFLGEMLVGEMQPARVRAAALGATVTLPPELDGWFASCVVRQPTKRFANAAVAWRALDAVLAAPVPRVLPALPATRAATPVAPARSTSSPIAPETPAPTATPPAPSASTVYAPPPRIAASPADPIVGAPPSSPPRAPLRGAPAPRGRPLAWVAAAAIAALATVGGCTALIVVLGVGGGDATGHTAGAAGNAVPTPPGGATSAVVPGSGATPIPAIVPSPSAVPSEAAPDPFAAARAFERGREAERRSDWSASAHGYSEACNLGLAEGCTADCRIREERSRSVGGAEPACELACTRSRDLACAHLARILEGSDQPGVGARARELYDIACTRDVAWACNNLGALFADGRCGPMDDARADAYFHRACDLGSSEGCTNVARRAQQRSAPAVDGPGEVQARERACLGGSAGDCDRAGYAYFTGAGVPMQRAHAAELYARGCDLQSARSCANLGVMLRDGNGVPASPLEAALALRRACQLGDSASCDR